MQFGANFELGKRIVARYNEIRIYIDSSEDINIFFEIFFTNEYTFISPSDCMVIDIGMNVGIASLAFAENAMVKEVHGFEPFLAPFLRAKQNFDLNPELSRKIKANNYGLSNKNEKLIVKSDDLSTIGTSIRGADEGRIETIEVRPDLNSKLALALAKH